jgi:hypothetical protein
MTSYPATQTAVHLNLTTGVGGSIDYLAVPAGGYQLVWQASGGVGAASGVSLGTDRALHRPDRPEHRGNGRGRRRSSTAARTS